MSDFWAFLSDGTNQAVLATLGVAVAFIIRKCWTIYTYFDQRRSKRATKTPSLAAEQKAPSTKAAPSRRNRSIADQKTTTVSITVTGELHLLMKQRVREGRYDSISAYVRDLLWADIEGSGSIGKRIRSSQDGDGKGLPDGFQSLFDR